MRIRGIHLEHFGCYDRLDLAFAPGLNIIRGPNGAGKSTLQRALLKVLFDKPSKTVANEKERAWGESQLYRLTLEFEEDSQGSCQLMKDFETNRCRLLLGDSEELTRAADVQDKMARFVGTASDKLFKSTLFVAQRELAELTAGKEIHTSLEERVTGGQAGVTTQTILDRLKRKIDEYAKGYGPGARATTKPGPIVRTQREIDDLDAKIAALRSRLEEQARCQAQHDKLAQDLTSRHAEYSGWRDLLDQIEKVKRLRIQVDEATGEEKRLEQLLDHLNSAQATLDAAMARLEALKPVSDIDERSQHALLELRSKLDFLQAEPMPSLLLTPAQARPRRPLPAIGLAIVGLVSAMAGGTLLVLPLVDPLLALSSLALGLLFLLIGGLWWLVHSLHWRRTQRAAQGDADAARTRHEAAIAQARAELQQALLRLNCASWEEYSVKYHDAQVARSARDQAQAQVAALVSSNGDRETLEAERREASRQRRDGQEALGAAELQPALGITPLDHQQLLRRIAEREIELTNLTQELHELKGRQAADPVSQTELTAAEEKRTALVQKNERQQELLAVYQCIHATLSQARERVIERMRQDLQESTCRHLARLTLGSFSTVAIDQDLRPLIAMPGYADIMATPDDLSCGQHDQLYFAMRLALIESLWAGETLPLFLDDPFVSFDPARQQAAIQLLHELGQTRQVFFFTCSDRYDTWGHVIELQAEPERVAAHG